METNVNYTMVGAFVLVLFAFICLSVIWLSRGLSLEHYTTYAVYMEESVTGLSVDAPIEFNGVAVGTVTSITINHRNPRLVQLLLSIKDGTPITQGTVATLSSRGITGIAYVALKDSGSDLSPLLKQPGQDYAEIKSAPSLFSRLDTGLERVNASLYKISSAIESILDPQNQVAIKNIIMNVDQVGAMLAKESANMSEIIQNTQRASRAFPILIQNSQGAVKTFSAETLPAADRAMKNMDAASRNLLEITTEIKGNPAILIRGKGPTPLGSW